MSRLLVASQKFVGTEPNFKDVSLEEIMKNEKLMLIQSLNWYSSESNQKESMTWLQKEYPGVKFTHAGTAGFLCRMMHRGYPKELLKAKVDALVPGLVEAEKVKEPVFEQKLVEEVFRDPSVEKHCEMIDYTIDDFLQKKSINPKVVITGLNKKQSDLVKAYASRYLAEFTGASKKEGYENITLRLENAIVGYLQQVLQKLNVAAPVKERKPRAPKAVSIEKVVKAYLFSNYNDYKSVHPSKLVGSTMALVFDQDNRRLSLFVAEEGKELSIKSRSIINYDETKSFAKLLRKPLEQIPEILKASKLTITKRLNEVKSTSAPAKHRSHENITILRIW